MTESQKLLGDFLTCNPLRGSFTVSEQVKAATQPNHHPRSSRADWTCRSGEPYYAERSQYYRKGTKNRRMYIGPWQEYNLSKSRPNRVSEQLRPGIEQALLSSLDPEVAKKAMEAMMPYFDKPNVPLYPRAANAHPQPSGRKRAVRVLPSLHSSVNSPLAISARERSLYTSSPLSVRSTQSEPIRYSHGSATAQPHTPPVQTAPQAFPSIQEYDQAFPPLVKLPRHTQPAYNSTAMVNLLRMERNSKARSEIAKLTGWKMDTNSESGDSATSKPKPAKDLIEMKKEQVNLMKQLYMTGQQKAENSDGGKEGLTLPPISQTNGVTQPQAKAQAQGVQLTASNLAQHNTKLASSGNLKDAQRSSVPAGHDHHSGARAAQEEDVVVMGTPRIGDVDLTDEAFSLVSKYFQSSDITPAPAYTQHAAAKTGARAVGIAGYPAKMLHSLGVETPMNDDLESETNSVYMPGATAAHSPKSPKSAALAEEPGNMDELYVGGMDGLLLWSSQLELDC